MTNEPLLTVASVTVAAISWHCFEGPINRLKARLEYSEARPTGVGPHVVPAPSAEYLSPVSSSGQIGGNDPDGGRPDAAARP